MKIFKRIKQTVMIIAILLITGCTATSTSIEHRNLAINTKMSDSIFVTPVNQDQKTVLLQVKNTSDKSDFYISPLLTSKLQSEGYTIVHSVDKAHYLLQVNILKIEKMTPQQADAVLAGGFGAVLGGVTGSVVSNGDAGTTLAGAVIGGLASTIANSMVKDVNIVAVVDVQLSERTNKTIKQTTQTNIKQGSSTIEKQSSSSTTNWQRYRTRVVTTADKVNLDYAQAKDPLEKAIANSVGGIL